MKNKQRFVFDTNSLVSVILSPSSTNRRAVEKAEKLGELVFSRVTALELVEVLSRSKFDPYVPFSKRITFAEKLIARSVVLEVVSSFKACRDEKDDMFLHLAVDATASCIITQDKDLLVLHPFRDIPVVRPSDFLDSF